MVIAPLVIYLTIKRDRLFLIDTAREVLNFQISIVIYVLLVGVVCCLLMVTAKDLASDMRVRESVALFVGAIFFITFVIVDIFCSVKGACKAYRGEKYKYPLNLRLVK
jgi:hypothetical protein